MEHQQQKEKYDFNHSFAGGWEAKLYASDALYKLKMKDKQIRTEGNPCIPEARRTAGKSQHKRGLRGVQGGRRHPAPPGAPQSWLSEPSAANSQCRWDTAVTCHRSHVVSWSESQDSEEPQTL